MNSSLQYPQLNKPDILAVLEHEGIKVRRAGKSYRGKCNFHDGKSHGSLAVYPEEQNWFCFGCSIGGDVVDFVMQLHKLSFKDALTYLGIRNGRPLPPDPAKERERQRLKAYVAWQKEHYLDLCDQAIEIHALRIKARYRQTRLPEDLAWFMAEQLAKLPKIKNDLDIFQSKDDEAIFEIFKNEGRITINV